MDSKSEKERGLPVILQATEDFQRVFSRAMHDGEDVQIKLLVSIKGRAVKFVKVQQERNYELDEDF